MVCTSLHVMHFPAILRNYNGMTGNCGIVVYLTKTDWRGGRTSLLLCPGAENPSYASAWFIWWMQT